MVHSSAKVVATIGGKWKLQPAAKRHCRHTRRTTPYFQTDKALDEHSRSPLKPGLTRTRQPRRPTQRSRPSRPSPARHPLASRLVMMWHTHEQRLLTPEESPTMEQA